MVNDDRNTSPEFRTLTLVLEAEKTAQEQLDAARTQSDAILQEAQGNARRIATRADKRIQALHSRFRENLAQKKVKSSEVFQRERHARETPIGADKVKEATNRLARHIVGVTQE